MEFPNSYENFPEGTYGYIYETIHLPTNKKYIGKKALIYNTKKKLSKKELNEWTGRGRPPAHKIVEGNTTLLPPVESCVSLVMIACPDTGFAKERVVVALDKVNECMFE